MAITGTESYAKESKLLIMSESTLDFWSKFDEIQVLRQRPKLPGVRALNSLA
ncbi:MAG: hypothetical protein ACI9S8_003123 [Chlamydiales bacterium]